MKKELEYKVKNRIVKKKISYVPLRYVLAVMLAILEVACIISIVLGLCYHLPYFYILAYLTQIGCVLKIVSSDDNPDYKIPWLIFVIILPIAGFMLYILFYSRKLKKKHLRRLYDIKNLSFNFDDGKLKEKIKEQNSLMASIAEMICATSGSKVFTNTEQVYFKSGESMFESMLIDLENAKKFIYLEYFLIEEGLMWNSILHILRKKADEGLDVKVIYDDIGCMTKLPARYCNKLRKYGIQATTFARLKGHADGEFNNRNHRKILVIDGCIGYTGGVNLADEYINQKPRFGHWKDGGLRLKGNAVWSLTELFLMDYGISVKEMPKISVDLYPYCDEHAKGYVIPFSDGPKPLYNICVGKRIIQSMLSSANEYVYITTPYLIIDNELCGSIESAALRGVDVRIILPHIPDKKLVFDISRSYYNRLMDAGVKIYEYKSGFIHAKTYLCDGVCAMVGTINLDYRSLVHHFENGVWLYGTDSIEDIKADLEHTFSRSIKVERGAIKAGFFKRLKRSVVKIFAPLL